MATKLIKSIKDHLTPHFMQTLRAQGTMLTVLWVSSVCFVLGFSLALVCLYSRILVLEQAVAVLAR